MAAVLLGTGTTGSEGALGGLVEEGRHVRHHLREAWDLGRIDSTPMAADVLCDDEKRSWQLRRPTPVTMSLCPG
jgi:hypothetical protein